MATGSCCAHQAYTPHKVGKINSAVEKSYFCVLVGTVPGTYKAAADFPAIAIEELARLCVHCVMLFGYLYMLSFLELQTDPVLCGVPLHHTREQCIDEQKNILAADPTTKTIGG